MRSIGLTKTILQGTVKGEQWTERLQKQWEDNIKNEQVWDLPTAKGLIGVWREIVFKLMVLWWGERESL